MAYALPWFNFAELTPIRVLILLVILDPSGINRLDFRQDLLDRLTVLWMWIIYVL